MNDERRIGPTMAIVLAAGLTVHAGATELSTNPIAVAVRHGDCRAAVDLVIHGAASNDGPAVYLGGRMLDAGICVHRDLEAAAKFFARAADLGDHDSSLEYAAKVGMGEGFEQNYQRAGEICRGAGIDPQTRLSSYSLGYACTVRGVAGRLLRERLPAGAFRPDSGALLVAFNPASAQMSIVSTPKVEVEADAPTGSKVRRQRVNARKEIEGAWQDALSAVPKPEPGHLDSQPAQLSLDVDMGLDQRQAKESVDPDRNLRGLRPQDILPNFFTKPL
ncbi:MAG TPA: hypothetical protein VMQ45_15780 [Burkholderiaceae bacterium]|nr:hypothetical protein [Burkholderiaceae bacterium]